MTKIIYHGDQYYIPLRVSRGGVVITPDDVDEIKVAVGGIIQKYPDGDLTFDGSENWLFSLRSDMSKTMVGQTPAQVQIIKGDTVQHSPKFTVEFDGSLFGRDA